MFSYSFALGLLRQRPLRNPWSGRLSWRPPFCLPWGEDRQGPPCSRVLLVLFFSSASSLVKSRQLSSGACDTAQSHLDCKSSPIPVGVQSLARAPRPKQGSECDDLQNLEISQGELASALCRKGNEECKELPWLPCFTMLRVVETVECSFGLPCAFRAGSENPVATAVTASSACQDSKSAGQRVTSHFPALALASRHI